MQVAFSTAEIGCIEDIGGGGTSGINTYKESSQRVTSSPTGIINSSILVDGGSSISIVVFSIMSANGHGSSFMDPLLMKAPTKEEVEDMPKADFLGMTIEVGFDVALDYSCV